MNKNILTFLICIGIVIISSSIFDNRSVFGAPIFVVPQGGTGTSTFTQYPIVGGPNSTAHLRSSSSPTVVSIFATSTTATSTFLGGIRVGQGVQFSNYPSCLGSLATDANGFLQCSNSVGAVFTDWVREINFGRGVLTPSTTIPIWIKDIIFASSTIMVDGTGTSTFLGPIAAATNTNATGRLIVHGATTTGELWLNPYGGRIVIATSVPDTRNIASGNLVIFGTTTIHDGSIIIYKNNLIGNNLTIQRNNSGEPIFQFMSGIPLIESMGIRSNGVPEFLNGLSAVSDSGFLIGTSGVGYGMQRGTSGPKLTFGTEGSTAGFLLNSGTGFSTTPLFQVVEGSEESNRHFTIDVNGFVGIGTPSPTSSLAVIGTTGIVAERFTSTTSLATSTFPNISAFRESVGDGSVIGRLVINAATTTGEIWLNPYGGRTFIASGTPVIPSVMNASGLGIATTTYFGDKVGIFNINQGEGMLLTAASSSTAIPVVVRRKEFQTANLTSWRSATDTVLAAIDPSGRVLAGGVSGEQPPSVPGLGFIGDTDTGFYFRAANTIGIMTNGSHKGFITNNGNLMLGAGAGTTESVSLNGTTTKLDIQGGPVRVVNSSAGTDGDFWSFAFRGGDSAGNRNSFVLLGNNNNPLGKIVSTVKTSGASGHLTFETSNETAAPSVLVERLKIDANGNIGIGTTSPLAKVNISSTSSPGFVITDPNGGSNAKHAYASSTTGSWGLGTVNDPFTAYVENLTIGSNGRVGIGTTTPYSILSVAGRAVFTNFVATSTTNNNGIGTTTPSSELAISNTATTTLYMDTSSATAGTCIQMETPNQVFYRIYVNNSGTLTTETGSCK